MMNVRYSNRRSEQWRQTRKESRSFCTDGQVGVEIVVLRGYGDESARARCSESPVALDSATSVRFLS